MSRMFPFITHTWNPLAGVCPHNCKGCWAKAYIKRMDMKKYQGRYYLDANQFDKKFKPGDFVFVCDMLDLFAKDVPMEAIIAILNKIASQPEVTFLLLTKNPRYMWLMDDLPKNVVAGATIETDINYELSKAPIPEERIKAMAELDHHRKMISVEPIMDFNFDVMVNMLIDVKPEFIAVGYDNYRNGFDEPDLATTEEFMDEAEKLGIKVYRKTLRECCFPAKDRRDKT